MCSNTLENAQTVILQSVFMNSPLIMSNAHALWWCNKVETMKNAEIHNQVHVTIHKHQHQHQRQRQRQHQHQHQQRKLQQQK